MRLINRRWTRQALTIVLLVGALSCMFPPANPVMRQWIGNIAIVAVGYLALGLVFLVFNRSRLMFVCFGCSAAISLFQLEIAPLQEEERNKYEVPVDFPDNRATGPDSSTARINSIQRQ